MVSREDHYVRIEGGKFDAEEFEKHPERYASTFSHQVLDLKLLKCVAESQ